MKNMKMIYPLAFALAAMLAAAGCAHKPVHVTSLTPGPTPPPVEPGPTTIPYNTGENPTGIPQAPSELFQGMIQDRAALANYTVHFKYDRAAVQKTGKANLTAVASPLHPAATTQ